MSESESYVGHLLEEYAECNTALFMFLGLTSLARKVEEFQAAASAHSPWPHATATKIDYLLLGLIAFARQIVSVAEIANEGAIRDNTSVVADPVSDILR
jgi:hypothetical protein